MRTNSNSGGPSLARPNYCALAGFVLSGWKPALLLALGLLGLLSAGCATEKQSAAPALAAAEVPDQAPSAIADVAVAVFRDHGYDITRHTKRDLTCDKLASGWNRFAYGGWTAAGSVWERVHLAIVPEGLRTRLEADAYLISNRGEPIEERLQFGHVNRKPLQQMLDEIVARLNQPPAELPPPVPEPQQQQ